MSQNTFSCEYELVFLSLFPFFCIQKFYCSLISLNKGGQPFEGCSCLPRVAPKKGKNDFEKILWCNMI